jgi:hypothetical protein
MTDRNRMTDTLFKIGPYFVDKSFLCGPLNPVCPALLALQSMGRHFEANMYAAQPPLVLPSHLPSTLTHYYTSSNDSWWERKWMRYGNLGII